MAKGNGRGSYSRGRARGGTNGRGRGRGRGGQNGDHGGYRSGRASGKGTPGSSFLEEELDFTPRMYEDAPKGPFNNRDRASGPNTGTSTPNRRRGRGQGRYDTPRGHGRGKGKSSDLGSSPMGPGRGSFSNTLSGQLYLERPFLRPIKFVPSELMKVLFQNEEDEELLKPAVEDVDETERSHIPTADRVFRVFSSGDIASESEDDEDQEEIEEVDFNEVEKLFSTSETDKTTTKISKSKLIETMTVEEQKFTGFYINSSPAGPGGKTDSVPQDVEVDVNNLAKIVEETLSATDADEPLGGGVADVAVAPIQEETIVIDQQEPFHVDVQPAVVPSELAPSGNNLRPSALRDDDEDDVIVYVAPHPRKSMKEVEVVEAPTTGPDTSHFKPYTPSSAFLATSIPSSSNQPIPIESPPTFSSVSFSFSQTATTATPGKKARLKVPPVSTPRLAKAWKRKRGTNVKKWKVKPSFGSFGAMREEALLHKEDPRKRERRRGDSDLDWGDSDDEGRVFEEFEGGLEGRSGRGKKDDIFDSTYKGKGKEIGTVDHGMDVDPDLQPDMEAMKRFVGGLLGADAGQHKTMDDAMIDEMIRKEDEDENLDSSSEDIEEGEVTSEDESEEDVLAAEEAMLISEALEFDDDSKDEMDSDESDELDEEADKTPRTSFQARLERLRNKARSKEPKETSVGHLEDDSDDDMLDRNMTWAEEDDDYIQQIQTILDNNEDVLNGRGRKERKGLFRSIQNGSFEVDDDDDEFYFSPAKKRKDRWQGLPPELKAQWEKDRAKKAESKKAREIAKLERAADPVSKKKGGKKGRKAMLNAAALDPTITVLPNRIIDITTLIQQLRRFIADLNGPTSMSLPPTNKETRKNVHELAIAFNLKSLSQGKGDARYTTLTRTTRTGLGVDEGKVAKIVRRSGGMGSRGDSFIYDKKSKGVNVSMPRHHEGEEVGKAAPKLTESNVGFRLLSMMGWSEGDRIGFADGLNAPLTAIIKRSKLGLGATK